MNEACFDKYNDDELLGLVDADIEQELRRRGYNYGWHKVMRYSGDIYILVNPAFPNLVKIGYADDVEKRVKTLNRNSGLPDPYHVYATYKVKKRLEDLKLHHLIDSLDPSLRHSRNREFYEMTPEDAYNILSAIAQINGDEELLILNPMNDSFFGTKGDAENTAGDGGNTNSKSRMTFSMLGISKGECIHFIEDDSVVATVSGDNSVEFENRIWTLSGLTRELKKRNNTANRSGSYQGGNYFTYNGKKLTDIRKEIDEKAESGCKERGKETF